MVHLQASTNDSSLLAKRMDDGVVCHNKNMIRRDGDQDVSAVLVIYLMDRVKCYSIWLKNSAVVYCNEPEAQKRKIKRVVKELLP